MRISTRALFRLCTVISLVLVSASAGSPLFAQDEEAMGEGMGGDMEAAAMMAMEKAMTPGDEHAMLADGVGTWKMTVKMWMDPAMEPTISEGTAERRMELGGRVLEENVKADMMGMPFEGIGRTGYDNVTGTWWSTWTDSMSTGLMNMTGTWDEATKTHTWTGEAADPMSGTVKPVKMTSHYEDGREVAEMYQPGPDGSMVRTMEIVYVRQ
jgi:hypothetical protein